MAAEELLIYHHLPKTGGTSLAAVVRENYGSGEVVELYEGFREAKGRSAASGTPFDATGWYRDWYEQLPDEDRERIRCVASHTANGLAPALERPWRAFTLLRDPVERCWSLFHFARALGRLSNPPALLPGITAGQEIRERGWSLADLYRELGGSGPRSSELHDRLGDFFNGQARRVLAPWRDPSKLEYWAGMPERGALLRDRALELLERHYVVGVQERFDRSLERFAAAFGWDRLSTPHLNRSGRRGQPDPETRAAILAHNQIDAELHAHFLGAVERDRSRPRRRPAPAAVAGEAVCVLGTPRSGTSLTARILNILGVDLGQENELMEAAAANNRAGFWEHRRIADLNEEILAALSQEPPPYLQGWRWPPLLPQGWERDTALEPYRRAAQSILRMSFAGSDRWGWKDPRSSLTLPFWQDLIPEMRYVVCVRDPLDVAASLQVRDGMSVEESAELWLRYMSAAVANTSGRPRIFVAYEDYFGDGEGQAMRLAAFLGKDGLTDAERETIAAHIDEGLWHHRKAKPGEGADGALLPAEVSELHAQLLELTQA